MTRINCIDPKMLTDKHLGAEYRELPRIFGLVRKAIDRGEVPNDPRNPKAYTLGKGHCRFFYNRLGYLVSRQKQLCDECKRRGRKVSFDNIDSLVYNIPNEWMNDWVPDHTAIGINKQRINERLGMNYD